MLKVCVVGSLNSRKSVMKCFDSYRFEKQKGGNKEPFRHKRVLQNAMGLNKTITACKEPLKNHIFLECLCKAFGVICSHLFNLYKNNPLFSPFMLKTVIIIFESIIAITSILGYSENRFVILVIYIAFFLI